MSFIILKLNPNSPNIIIVNDSEGIAMDWDIFESAQRMADIFQANSNHNCTYEVKEWRTPSN